MWWLALSWWLGGCGAVSGGVCCELASGAFGRADAAACADGDGVEIDAELCEAIGDPDLFLPEDVVDEPALPSCQAYCDGILEVCPGDDACEHSCETAPQPVSAEAVTCAADAADCSATGPCWDLLGL
jgi:hypothetical protein